MEKNFDELQTLSSHFLNTTDFQKKKKTFGKFLAMSNRLKKWARCLKITEKVSFNIASKASYVYILSGQKLIKNAKNGPFKRVFENLNFAVK